MAKNQAELKHAIEENKVHPPLLGKYYSERRYTTARKGLEFREILEHIVGIEIGLIVFGLCYVCIMYLQYKLPFNLAQC